MTNKEIRDLVELEINGKIFGSWRMSSDQIIAVGRLVFLPLAMGGSIPEGAAHAYAPYEKQIGSRGINGFPCFSSVAFLMEKDWRRFKALHAKVIKSQQEALNN